MSSKTLKRPKYISRGKLGMKLSYIAPATVKKLTKFYFSVEYNDEDYNLPYVYVDIYINDQFFTETQDEFVDLSAFTSLITQSSPFIKITVKTKRVVNGYAYYSDTETTLYAYDFFASNNTFCGDHQIVRG